MTYVSGNNKSSIPNFDYEKECLKTQVEFLVESEMELNIVKKHLGIDSVTDEMIESQLEGSFRLKIEKHNVGYDPITNEPLIVQRVVQREPPRNTLILREVPDTVTHSDLLDLLLQCGTISNVQSEITTFVKEVNNTWLANFRDEEVARNTAIALQTRVVQPWGNGISKVRCAIKSEFSFRKFSNSPSDSSPVSAGHRQYSEDLYSPADITTPNGGNMPTLLKGTPSLEDQA